MKRSWPLVAFGLAAYLLMLIIQLPAAQAWRMAKPHLGGLSIELYGLQGSVWQGRATHLRVQGYGPAQLDWRLTPMGLLRGQISADVQLHLGEGHLQGRLHLPFDRHTLKLEQIQGQLAMPWLTSQVPNLPVPLSGSVGLRLEWLQLDLHTAWPQALAGQLHWYQAGIVMGEPLALGDLTAQLSSVEGRLLARVSDYGGPLRADIQASLQKNGQYRVEGHVSAAEQAAPALPGWLSLLGQADGTGQHRLQWQGRL